MHINKGVRLARMSDFIMTLKWGHTWLTFRNCCSGGMLLYSQIKAELNILEWTRTCIAVKALTVPGHNLKTGTAEICGDSEHDTDSRGKKQTLHFIVRDSTAKLPLLFYSLEWRSFTPNTTILHSKLSRVIIKVTGNVELPGSWPNFGWLGRRASSVCKGCGFLNDHSGLGLQTLPITKPREHVWPLLEVSRSVHKVLELHKTHSHS